MTNIPPPSHPHRRAVLQALLVTFLWSTSWVLIKIGLVEIPALTFAGLRYVIAVLCLLPFFFRDNGLVSLRVLNKQSWGALIFQGIIFITLAQGAQFLGLAYLPAITVNFLLSFTSLLVALLGMVFLAEIPSRMQWLGLGLSLSAALFFFYPVQIPQAQAIGYAAVAIGTLANAAASILGRKINRASNIDPLTVTVISMGTGAPLLLAAGILVQGLPQLSLQGWLILLWLAIINTAFAFTLWNLTLRTLTAMESSIINNTMSVQIPILAVLFLNESMTPLKIVGIVLAIIGATLVQVYRPLTNPAVETAR
jgi:drug/metabolite transporter (DMT)-like permease